METMLEHIRFSFDSKEFKDLKTDMEKIEKLDEMILSLEKSSNNSNAKELSKLKSKLINDCKNMEKKVRQRIRDYRLSYEEYKHIPRFFQAKRKRHTVNNLSNVLIGVIVGYSLVKISSISPIILKLFPLLWAPLKIDF